MVYKVAVFIVLDGGRSWALFGPAVLVSVRAKSWTQSQTANPPCSVFRVRVGPIRNRGEIMPDVGARRPESKAPLAGRWVVRSHPPCPRGQSWDDGIQVEAAADRQPIATYRAIHHRRHHHRESAETRVTRGRGRV